MNLSDAFSEIESTVFVAFTNVASDFPTFIRAARQFEGVQVLLNRLEDEEVREAILDRIWELSDAPVDQSYENPWDAPLAVYLWILDLKDPELALVAAEAASDAPQTWWAGKLAHVILQQQTITSDAADAHYDISWAPTNVKRPNVKVTAFAGDQTQWIGLASKSRGWSRHWYVLTEGGQVGRQNRIIVRMSAKPALKPEYSNSLQSDRVWA